MGYLIPKSARNVKMQLFKGLGVVEAAMVIIAAVICILVFKTSFDMPVKIAIIVIIGFVTLFMVSPSFIVNKKGYQCFGVLFDYMSQEKYYRKKSLGKKNGR